MHAGAGLGDDAFLAHPARHQNLAEHIVDLVGAGVIELLALQIDLGAAARNAGRRPPAMLGETLGVIERRRPADIMRQIAIHLGAERGIGLGGRVGLFQFQDQRHQRLGDKAPAIDAEMTVLIGPGTEGIALLHTHRQTNLVMPRGEPAAPRPRAPHE